MYYKDHSANWWRRNGQILYQSSFFLLLICVIIYVLPYTRDFISENYLIILCFGFFELVLVMLPQGLGCRLYIRNAYIAEMGGYDSDKSYMNKVNAMMLWAWAIDSAAFMIYAGIGFASAPLELCISLSVFFALLVATLIPAIIYTKKYHKGGKTNKNKN